MSICIESKWGVILPLVSVYLLEDLHQVAWSPKVFCQFTHKAVKKSPCIMMAFLLFWSVASQDQRLFFSPQFQSVGYRIGINFLHFDHWDITRINTQIFCHNPNSTTTQLKTSWVWHENEFTQPTHHHNKLNVSNIWPDFYQSLKLKFLGSTTTTKATFNLLLTRFWPNFK